MTYTTIRFDVANGIANLTLDRPDRLNAFTVRMHEEVADVLTQIENDSAVRVLTITGAGKGFSAGQDLAERDVHAGPLDLGYTTRTYYNPMIRRLAALPIPVVCCVNGVAAGAGVSLALAGDVVIARSSARFVQAFSRIGLIPDAGGTWLLPQLAGQARALGFALTGGELSAQTAQEWGLIWKAIPDEEFDTQRDALVEQLARGPTQGLAHAKFAIRHAARATLSEQLDVESDLQKMCGLTDDYREGVSAFKERRAPRFTGR